MWCVTAGVELGSGVARGASGASPGEIGSLTRATVGQQEETANWPSASWRQYLGQRLVSHLLLLGGGAGSVRIAFLRLSQY